MATRSRAQGKTRALATATRVSESCLGVALLRNHVGEDRAHLDKLRRLEKESRSVQNELEHQRKQFVKRRLGTPGPLIILEQTRSPAPLSKDEGGSERRGRRRPKRGRRGPVEVRGKDEEYGSRPGYMRPTLSRGSVACLASTIGAFRISTQRPLDEWNPTALQKIYFKSAVTPSWPLTESDLGELRNTLNRHCWVRKFRDPVRLASVESGNESNKSKKPHRSAGLIRRPSDQEQRERDRKEHCAEEKLKIPVIYGSHPSDSKEATVTSRSHSRLTSFDSIQFDQSPSPSKEIEQWYKGLHTVTNHSISSDSMVFKPDRRSLSNKGSNSFKVQPMFKNQELLFKTSIEYSISSSTADIKEPENPDESNNTVSSKLLAGKRASAGDALPEMTSFLALRKSLRAVSFSDDVIKIGCRMSNKDRA